MNKEVFYCNSFEGNKKNCCRKNQNSQAAAKKKDENDLLLARVEMSLGKGKKILQINLISLNRIFFYLKQFSVVKVFSDLFQSHMLVMSGRIGENCQVSNEFKKLLIGKLSVEGRVESKVI